MGSIVAIVDASLLYGRIHQKRGNRFVTERMYDEGLAASGILEGYKIAIGAAECAEV